MTTRALAYTIAFAATWAFLLYALARFCYAIVTGEIQ